MCLHAICSAFGCGVVLQSDLSHPSVPSYRLIYYLDPSVLTGVSGSVMLLCLADYLVPTLAPRIFGSHKW